jgi:hypothetical protein
MAELHFDRDSETHSIIEAFQPQLRYCDRRAAMTASPTITNTAVRRKLSAGLFLLVGVTFLTDAVAGLTEALEHPCKPVASIEGPGPMVAQIRAILEQHDVRAEIDPGCPGRLILVRIEALRDGAGYTVSTADDEGRSSARVFVDAATAASLIESWVTDESAALLATVPVPPAASATRPPPPPRFHLLGGLETSLARDRSWWVGVAIGACARTGPLCSGARVRSTRDLDLLGASKNDVYLRNGFEALLFTSWPINLQGLSLIPQLGLGAGWLRTTTEGGLLIDAASIDDRGPRLEVGLLSRWPADSPIALAAEASASWSPRANTADRRIGNMLLIGEPGAYLRLTMFCLVTL